MELLQATCILNPLENYFRFGNFDAARLPALVMQSAIRGKGWKGLRAAEKWHAFSEADAPEKEIVCLISGDCAAELMLRNPSAVFVGAALTAKAFGIDSVWMVTDRTTEIPDQFLGVEFQPFSIEHNHSSGEETRVISAIEEGLPIARLTPPYPASAGLFGRPTLLHSAEFFAHLPYLCVNADADTKLVRLIGDVDRAGVAEIRLGTSLRELLALCGGEAKAVQLGGVTGPFLPVSQLDTPYDPDSIFIGDGSVRVLAPGSCMVQETLNGLRAAYPDSCGKCVFCREGGYQQYLIWKDIAAGKGLPADLKNIQAMAKVMHAHAACGYGQSIGGMVESVMTHFCNEVAAHIEQKKCPELVCPTMIKVYIAPDKCTGCGKCAEACPSHAIDGGDGLIHVVRQNDCTGCLACSVCPEGAVARISAKGLLPSLPENPISVGTFMPKKKGLQRRAKT